MEKFRIMGFPPKADRQVGDTEPTKKVYYGIFFSNFKNGGVMIHLMALLVHQLCGGDCTITLPNGEVLPNTYEPKPKEEKKNPPETDDPPLSEKSSLQE